VQKYRELTILPEPKIEEIGVSYLLSGLQLLFEKQFLEEDIEFSRECMPENLVILADRKMIEQVLINLLKNAICAVDRSEDKKVELSASGEPDNGITITVKDTGCGIASEDLDKIFIPFFTTREKGSGIGLSLSRQIMLMHGGSLSVEAGDGGGSTLLLRFVQT